MRPRVFPAEDVELVIRNTWYSCFNEAAGIPRGRRATRNRDARGWRSFNEAAGIPRGRRSDGNGMNPHWWKLQ